MIARGIALSNVVASALREYAETNGITQASLARQTGISQAQVSKLWNRKSKMTLAALDALSVALGLDPIEVLREAYESLRS